MNIEKAIKVLQEIQLQFENSVNEAEIGELDAIEAREDNQNAVDAINLAIQALEKQILKRPSLLCKCRAD